MTKTKDIQAGERTQKAIVIDTQDVERDYGFDGTRAIIDHPRHGRLLIEDGFGGTYTLAGGCVRWRHGSVYQLLADDTFESLGETTWNETTNGLDAVIQQCDTARPYLHWPGYAIANLAKSLGLK